jgi:hypothetical protein
VPNADKVIWSIKASAQFNSSIAFNLREGLRSGRIRLLQNEYDAEEQLETLRGYSSLNPAERMQLKLPYIHTTLLVDELINLQHEESNGKVRVFEKSGARKDRYSSLAYSYYVAMQLEAKLSKRYNAKDKASEMFIIKPPYQNGKVVKLNGKKESGWKSFVY